MNVLVDTLSISWKYDNIYTIISFLNLTEVPWQPLRLRHYEGGQYYEGIVMGWNYDEKGSVIDTFLDLSGKGCRMVEHFNPNFNWEQFILQYIEEMKTGDCHVARIDIAGDDKEEKILDIDQIRDLSMKGYYVCKSKVLPDVRYKRTEEVYFGSPKSDRLLRIYNKALEQGLPDEHWIRVEFQLRNDNALSFILNWASHPIGQTFAGVLINYLRFLDPDQIDDIDAVKRNFNACRYPTVDWWDRFVSGASALSQIYLPAPEYTLDRIERYIKHQTMSSLKTYLIAHGHDLNELMALLRRKELTPKQKQLLASLPQIKPEDYEF